MKYELRLLTVADAHRLYDFYQTIPAVVKRIRRSYLKNNPTAHWAVFLLTLSIGSIIIKTC